MSHKVLELLRAKETDNRVLLTIGRLLEEQIAKEGREIGQPRVPGASLLNFKEYGSILKFNHHPQH